MCSYGELLDVVWNVGFSYGSLPRSLDRWSQEAMQQCAGECSVSRGTAQLLVSIVQRRLQDFPPRYRQLASLMLCRISHLIILSFIFSLNLSEYIREVEFHNRKTSPVITSKRRRPSYLEFRSSSRARLACDRGTPESASWVAWSFTSSTISCTGAILSLSSCSKSRKCSDKTRKRKKMIS